MLKFNYNIAYSYLLPTAWANMYTSYKICACPWPIGHKSWMTIYSVNWSTNVTHQYQGAASQHRDNAKLQLWPPRPETFASTGHLEKASGSTQGHWWSWVVVSHSEGRMKQDQTSSDFGFTLASISYKVNHKIEHNSTIVQATKHCCRDSNPTHIHRHHGFAKVYCTEVLSYTTIQYIHRAFSQYTIGKSPVTNSVLGNYKGILWCGIRINNNT